MASPLDPAFDRARLAVLYLLGDRGDALDARSPEGALLVNALANPDRGERAATLAGEIRRIRRALCDLSL